METLDTAACVKATHDELDVIAKAFPDRDDVTERIRSIRHSLRLVAGGDQDPDLMRSMAGMIADLHCVTREGSA